MMSMAYEEYMREIVKPMRQELTDAGFKELTTPVAVDDFMKDTSGTSLVVVNSVCGCAAGLARPAIVKSLVASDTRPESLVTVFAGQDREATARMREHFGDIEPSSPSVALLKDGKVAHFIPREVIEESDVEEILAHLTEVYNKYC